MNQTLSMHIQRRPQRGDSIILEAIDVLKRRLRKPGAVLSSPGQVRAFMMLQLAELECEVFTVIFLDSQNRLIEAREMFRGTVTQTSVYPREVVREALDLNASAVILVHNHPSGEVGPSCADSALTDALKKSLALIDVRVIDHFIVAGTETPYSFAENGAL